VSVCAREKQWEWERTEYDVVTDVCS